MRKLKLQVQITIDGFIAGPNGEMDCMVFDWDDSLKQYVDELTTPVDTIVLGRKLAEGFIPYWASVAADAQNQEQSAGIKFTDTPKVVFSKTIQQSAWSNTTIANGELAEEIGKLKVQSGGDIIAYGGAAFVSSLIEQGLVDEYHLFVNPSAIGSGMPIFNKANGCRNFSLVKATPFDCGIVVLHYVPKQD